MTQKKILELALSAALEKWQIEEERVKGMPEEFHGRAKAAFQDVKTIERLLKAEEKK